MSAVTLRKLGIGIALGASLAAFGCGGEKTETPAAPAGAEPGAAAPAPGAPGGADAAQVIEDVWVAELPANFPEDVPQYPGAEVVKARPTTDAAVVVGFITPDDPAKVAAYFADAFAAKGWSTNRVDAPEGIMVFADKGDRSATYGVATADGKTQIDLLVVEMR